MCKEITVKTRLYLDDTDKVQALLDDVQERARTRLITTEELYERWNANPLRKTISRTCPKNAIKGTRVTIHSDWGQLCNSYKKASFNSTPDATKIDLEYDGKGWRVKAVRRSAMATHGINYGIEWHPSENLKDRFWEMQG